MSASLKQYQSHFLAVVQEKRQLGLDEKSVIAVELINAVHVMETRVNHLHESCLLVTMLMMRRDEKDFILRRDRKYGDEMKIRAGEFTTGLANVDAPEAAKAELKQKLADYQRDFFAWMETALKLSVELKAMSETFSLVEPVVEEIAREVDALRTEAERSRVAVHENVQWEMAITVTLIAALVLAAGIFIGR